MPDKQELTDLKNQIKTSIRRNSDRGFVPYSGCNRVCAEIQTVLQAAEQHAEANDHRQAFDIYIMSLLETVRLVYHADDSSGCCGDIIFSCFSEIDNLCKTAAASDAKHFFNTIIKTAENKAFEDWAEWAYRLLKSAVYFVSNQNQAQKIYDLFPNLGKMYGGSDYPEKLLITLGIIERLEGKEAANKYLMDNIDVPELIIIAVENAISDRDFALAEQLCKDALDKNIRGQFNRPKPWLYFLEQIYAETKNTDELLGTVRDILLSGDTAYFRKLKALYEQQGLWRIERETLWQEISKKVGIQNYVTLLSQESEYELLFEVVKRHNSYIQYYGKQLAEKYPDEVSKIYEEYIFDEARQATDRGKYKRVCYIIKSLAEAIGKRKALEIIEGLREKYFRRPAMLDELTRLGKRFLH